MREISFEECPIVVSIDVQWRDLDVLAHVNNAEYIKWFESARIEALRDLGLLDDCGVVPTSAQVGPILGSISCRYLKPVGFPARVHIGTFPSRLGNSSFNLSYVVVLDSTKETVAVGDSVVVNYDYATKKSAPLSVSVRSKIEAYLKQLKIE